MSTVFTTEQQAKLKNLISEGLGVMTEVETLQGGLKDTVKAIAEELNVKPSILNKALRIAYRSEFQQEQADHETLETILTTVGRTL